MEAYVNTLSMDYQKLPATMMAYMRIQTDEIMNFLLSGKWNPEPWHCTKSPFNDFCPFASLLADHFKAMTPREGRVRTVLSAYSKLEKSMKFLPPIAYFAYQLKDHPAVETYQTLWRLQSNKSGVDSSGLFFLETQLAMLNTIKDKSSSKDVNTLMSFLRHLGRKDQLLEASEQKGKNNVSVTDCKEMKLEGQNAEMPTPPMLSPYDEACSARLWKLKKSNAANFVFGMAGKIKRHMYVLYMQLVYLQTLDLEGGTAQIIAQLLSYTSIYELPYDSEAGYMREINLELNNAVKRELDKESLPWNFLDMLYTFVQYSDMRIINDLKNEGRSIKELQKHLQALKKDQDVKVAKKSFGSYLKLLKKIAYFDKSNITNCNGSTILHLKGILGRNPTVEPQEVCKEFIQAVCPQFCDGLALFDEFAKNKKLLSVLHDTAHPLAEGISNQTGSMHPTVPFCFAGRQVTNILEKIDIQGKFEHPTGPRYGYSFCQNTQMTYTDLGICTTLNYQPETVIRQGMSMLTVPGTAQGKLEYPQMADRAVYKDGLILVLDSWSFNDIVSPTHDTVKKSFNIQNRVIQSSRMNNFKALLHSGLETPMMMHAKNFPISLENDNLYPKSLRTFFTTVRVEVQDADENIRNIDVGKRRCRFEDEVYGLEIFSAYSEQNCIFECRLRLSRAKCGCVPWNFPFGHSDQVCDPLGSVCFHRHFVWLSTNVNDVEGIGSPPCGCYPGCRSFRYVPVEQRQDASSQWLNVGWWVTQFNYLRENNGIADVSKCK